MLAEIEERVVIEANLSPHILDVSMPRPHPRMPAIDNAADPHCRMKLDARIAERDELFYVACVKRLHEPAMELDILLRHGLTLLRRSERCRTGQCCLARKAVTTK